MMKKFIAISLLVVVCLSLFTACGSTDQNASTGNSSVSSQDSKTDGKLFDNPVTLSIMIPSNPSYPYKEDWYIVKALQEKTNVTLKVDAVLNSNNAFDTKLNLVMASGDIPDIISPIGDSVIKKYGDQGAFVDAFDNANMEKTPNFKKWANENKDYVSKFMTYDNKVFMYPEKGIEEANRRGWLYREDIFKKNNLTVPKDEKELYTVLKKLKELYPKSYPFAFRTTGLSQLMMLAPSWGTDYQDSTHQFYYSTKTKDFTYGPIEDNFKDMITFYNKLYNEKLIPPNILTLDTKGWQDIMSNGDAFITVDYLSRIDSFNIPLQKTDPSYNLQYMAPPKGGIDGVNRFADSSTGTYGFIVSAKSKQLDITLKYVDWFYTKEAADLTTWGEEGKTFNVADGKNKFIGDSVDVAQLRAKTGLSTYGFYQLFDYDSHISTFSKDTQSAYEQSRNYDLSGYVSLAFTPEEQAVINSVGVNIAKATDQQISRFIVGDRNLNEWDKYVEEIKDLGLDKLKNVYDKAYERQQAAQK